MPSSHHILQFVAAIFLVTACTDSTHPNVTPASVALTPASTSIQAGGNVQLSAVVRNSNGDALSNQAISYNSSVSSVASVSSTGLVTSLGPTGIATIQASVGTLASASATITVTAGAAAKVTKLTTDPVSVIVSTSFSDSVRVQVTDAYSNPAPGASVAFAVTAGGGTVSPATAVTDANGKAAARFVVGSTVGAANSLTATVPSIAPVTYTTIAATNVRNLTVKTYSTFTATKPIAVLDNADNVLVSQYTTNGASGSAFTQSAYLDSRRAVDARVFYGANDVPSKIYDAKTGQQIVVVQRDNRVDFLVYSATGQYVTGVAIISSQSKLYLAKVISNPAFSGQISAASDNVSFSMTSQATSGLGPLVEAPATFETFYNQNVGKAPTSAAFLRATGSAIATSALSGNLQSTLTKAGLFLMATGVALPALGIAAGTLPIALFAAGLGAIAIGNVPNFHVSAIDQFDSAIAKFFEDGVAVDQSPTETVTAASTTLFSNGTLLVKGLGNLLTKAGNSITDALTSFVNSSSGPAASGGPAAGTSSVDGYGVDKVNTLYPLTGTVSSAGAVSATGTSTSRTLTVTGTVTGSNFAGNYSGSPGTGSIFGSAAPLAACQTQTQSGGQGTFAKAFNMGVTSGSVSFSYDAYTIPDAFQVATGGSAVFTTGGLVSGAGSTAFQLKGSSVVFVTVTAPLSGTAWEFALDCPR
jgi:hypothetical protein